jgi:hypothetical protein
MIVCFVKRSAKIGTHGRKLTRGPNEARKKDIYFIYKENQSLRNRSRL